MDAARTAEDPKALIARWFEEVWNQGRVDLIDEFRASNAVATGLAGTGETSHGPDPFKTFYGNRRSALPDFHITVENMLAEGNQVAVRISGTGTHTGEGLGVPPTGKKVQFGAMIMTRVENGKIAQAWNNIDMLSLLTQIGAVHDPVGPERFLAAKR